MLENVEKCPLYIFPRLCFTLLVDCSTVQHLKMFNLQLQKTKERSKKKSNLESYKLRMESIHA